MSVAVIVGASPAFTSVNGSVPLFVVTAPPEKVSAIAAGIVGDVRLGLAVAVEVKSMVCRPS